LASILEIDNLAGRVRSGSGFQAILTQKCYVIVAVKSTAKMGAELGPRAVETSQNKIGEAMLFFLYGRLFKTNLHKVITAAADRKALILQRKAWHIFRRTWASLMLQTGCQKTGKIPECRSGMPTQAEQNTAGEP